MDLLLILDPFFGGHVATGKNLKVFCQCT